MARYFLRIEMVGANPEQYDQLHDFMRRLGFTQTIKPFALPQEQLPSGCYQGNSDLPVYDVKSQAQAATDAIGVMAYIFVCEFTEWDSVLPAFE